MRGSILYPEVEQELTSTVTGTHIGDKHPMSVVTRGFVSLIVYTGLVIRLVPCASAQGESTLVRQRSNGWQPHEVRQLTGKAGDVRLRARFQIVTESWNRVVAVPYIVNMPE